MVFFSRNFTFFHSIFRRKQRRGCWNNGVDTGTMKAFRVPLEKPWLWSAMWTQLKVMEYECSQLMVVAQGNYILSKLSIAIQNPLSQIPVQFTKSKLLFTWYLLQGCGTSAGVEAARSWDGEADPPALWLHLWSEHGWVMMENHNKQH